MSRPRQQQQRQQRRRLQSISAHLASAGDAADHEPDTDARAALAALDDSTPVVILELYEFIDAAAREAHESSLVQFQFSPRPKFGGLELYATNDLIGDGLSPDKTWHRATFTRYPSRREYLGLLESPGYAEGISVRAATIKRKVAHAFRSSLPKEFLALPRAQDKDQMVSRNPKLEVIDVGTTGDGSNSWPTDPDNRGMGAEVFVINLMRFKPNGGRESYAKYGEVTSKLMPEAHGGPVMVLTGEVSLVGGGHHGGKAWEECYLVRYASLQDLLEMNQRPEWKEANEKYRLGDRKTGVAEESEGGEGTGGGVELTWAFPTRASEE
jgi:hypothetical protein